MRRESAMWQKLRSHLVAAKLHPVRVENPIHPGTPDVNLCSGDWLELKAIADWPAKPHLKVRIDHFTPQQRVFLLERWRYAPGTTHLLLEVCAAKQWLLYDGDVAAKIVGRGTREEHVRCAALIVMSHELARIPAMILASKIVGKEAA